ncbi:Cof-type HAD-IIB family hydrolase [Enterococcus alishanensis]|uniref:Cof-type HAD-IIB family hydrolase n=1 Tax=Enterococcus alishanensis TaxID=1303817 RepID=A0ABS6T7R0_9ENTE|nr:Cof-type HAD-IIB family hydrolase [Enterococcus alishanensis]MBV7389065.1 Cof-type HAD-IIB family hydrolase [Enterococcus alishanensis]
MIKAIFFDIDGTLVTTESKALDSTRKAIAAAQAKGILCGIATGRGPVDIEERIDHLPMDMFVTYNGQIVFSKEKTIFAEPFSQEVLDEIVDFADRERRQIIFGGRHHVEGSSIMKFSQSAAVKKIAGFIPSWFPVRMTRKFMQKFSSNRKKERFAKLGILKEPIYQCVLFAAESENQKLAELLPNCSFQRSNPYSIDIIPKNGSKYHGIEKFLTAFDIQPEEVMAFGDHFNDIEMLTHVGIGVAMGNGQAETKASADYVTDTNEADGIAKALKHFDII